MEPNPQNIILLVTKRTEVASEESMSEQLKVLLKSSAKQNDMLNNKQNRINEKINFLFKIKSPLI